MFLVFCFVVSFTINTIHPVKAQVTAIPFGGLITYTHYCTCSGGIALTVSGPVPAQVVFQSGVSVPFSFYQFYRPGPWVLGTYTAGGVCSYYVGTGCSDYPVTGTILIMGTSL